MPRKRKQRRQDSVAWKRFLNTILSQLITYIDQYPVIDQEYLKEFYSILQNYNVDIITSRKAISVRFEEYIKKYQQSEDYLKLPFLWFTRRYFINAHLLLSIEGFYAADFYSYLVKYLRGTTDMEGAFQLIRKGTPLTDFKWEQLQYACIRIINPLTRDELQAIHTIYSLISEAHLKVFDIQRIKAAIKTSVNSPEISRNFNRFFTLIDARGGHWFYPPAFDLKQLYFYFQLSELTSLSEIIDFQDPANTTLCASRVYQVKDFPNVFTGYIVIPTQLLGRLKNYLKRCEQQGKLILNYLNEITDIRISASLALYRAEKGWKELSPTLKKQLTMQLKTSNPRKQRKKSPIFFLTRAFNQNWNFRIHPTPSQVIDLYCKFFHEISLNEQLSSVQHSSHRYSKSGLSLLKDLNDINVCQLTFYPNRLLFEFSLDQYWINLPLIPFNQLSRLLKWLPYTRLSFTETGIHIWSFLTSEITDFLNTKLDWIVRPIIHYHDPMGLNFKWFNPKGLHWLLPKILEKGPK